MHAYLFDAITTLDVDAMRGEGSKQCCGGDDEEVFKPLPPPSLSPPYPLSPLPRLQLRWEDGGENLNLRVLVVLKYIL